MAQKGGEWEAVGHERENMGTQEWYREDGKKEDVKENRKGRRGRNGRKKSFGQKEKESKLKKKNEGKHQVKK